MILLVSITTSLVARHKQFKFAQNQRLGHFYIIFCNLFHTISTNHCEQRAVIADMLHDVIRY